MVTKITIASFFKTKAVRNTSKNSNTTPESDKLLSESQTACDTAINYLSNPTTEPSSPIPVVVDILENDDCSIDVTTNPDPFCSSMSVMLDHSPPSGII